MKSTGNSNRTVAVLAVGLLLSLVAMFPGKATAGAMITANSVSLADVSAAVAAASPGDTVLIPACTASWTSTLNIYQGTTLQGATTVSGDHTTGTWTANDLTVIQDSVPISGAAGNAAIIVFNC